MSDIPIESLRAQDDTFTLLGNTQIGKLDDYVQNLNEHGLVEIYQEDDEAALDGEFAKVMCSLLGLEKYVESLRTQVAKKYRVMNEI